VERRTDYSDMSQMTESAAPPLQNNAGRSFGRTAYHNPNNRGANTVNNNPNNMQSNGDNRHNRNVSIISSTNRRIAKSSKQNTRTQRGGICGKLEIDNHANTHAVGSNCTVINWTGRTCNVTPFSEHYPPMKDVEIVTAATAYDDSLTGETTILIFHEALWLGEHMVDSLINPNQCRIFGLSLCDDPFDTHRTLGISNSARVLTFRCYLLTIQSSGYELSKLEIMIRQGQDVSCVHISPVA
jgi:hypothetical protein